MNRSNSFANSSGGSTIYSEVISRGNSDSTDSRLLDAAQTLVTLQQTSGASPTSLSHHRRPQQHQGPKSYPDDGISLSRGQRMAPPAPPTSGTLQPMGPPPPPSSGTNVTTRYVVLQATSPSRGPVMTETVQSGRLLHGHNDHGSMQPPSQPPQNRRGRGSKRGGGATHQQPLVGGQTPTPVPSGRGRGRGRGRGAKAASATANQASNPANAAGFLDCDDDDVETLEGAEGLNNQAEEEEKRRKKNGAIFLVGSIPVRNDIFDEILNERKLELLLDAEVISVLEKHRSKPTSSSRHRTISNSGNSFLN